MSTTDEQIFADLPVILNPNRELVVYYQFRPNTRDIKFDHIGTFAGRAFLGSNKSLDVALSKGEKVHGLHPVVGRALWKLICELKHIAYMPRMAFALIAKERNFLDLVFVS